MYILQFCIFSIILLTLYYDLRLNKKIEGLIIIIGFFLNVLEFIVNDGHFYANIPTILHNQLSNEYIFYGNLQFLGDIFHVIIFDTLFNFSIGDILMIIGTLISIITFVYMDIINIKKLNTI